MNASLIARLVCPSCKQPLIAEDELRCSACGRRFPQRDPRWIDLLPDGWATQFDDWSKRQREMEQAYDELSADPAHARLAYRSDLDGYRGHLSRCAGRVLDIGGGYGLVRHYLPAATDYTVLDPSTSWFAQPWHLIADEFPCLTTPPPFVRGVAEHLPFPDASLDWVLSFWSINHLADPSARAGRVRASGASRRRSAPQHGRHGAELGGHYEGDVRRRPLPHPRRARPSETASCGRRVASPARSHPHQGA